MIGRTLFDVCSTFKIEHCLGLVCDSKIEVGPDIGQANKCRTGHRTKVGQTVHSKSDKKVEQATKNRLSASCPTAKSRSDTFFWGRTRKPITKFYRKRKIKKLLSNGFGKKTKI